MAKEWYLANKEKYEEDIKMFKDHHLQHICDGDEEASEYLHKLTAHVVQKPEEKMEILAVIIGAQGTGKTLIFTKIGEIFGKKLRHSISDMGEMFTRFNMDFMNKIWIIGEEATFHSKHQENNKLKKTITEKVTKFEPKYGKQVSKANYMFLIALSDRKWVLPISMAERRYFVVRTSDYYDGKFRNPDCQAHFRRLAAIDPKVLAYYYYNLDISTFNYRESPQTKEMRSPKNVYGC